MDFLGLVFEPGAIVAFFAATFAGGLVVGGVVAAVFTVVGK